MHIIYFKSRQSRLDLKYFGHSTSVKFTINRIYYSLDTNRRSIVVVAIIHTTTATNVAKTGTVKRTVPLAYLKITLLLYFDKLKSQVWDRAAILKFHTR